MADALLGALGKARVISRGPKATGALRAAGLREEWSPVSESSEEVLAHLTVDDLKGKRVAVQLHGATDDWDPVVLNVANDYPGSLAALRLADVLLVNPVRDGMNLVAKEGVVLSERDCAVVLSTYRSARICP